MIAWRKSLRVMSACAAGPTFDTVVVVEYCVHQLAPRRLHVRGALTVGEVGLAHPRVEVDCIESLRCLNGGAVMLTSL